MFAIENPSAAVEGKVSEYPNVQRDVTYRFGAHTITGDHLGGNNKHASDGTPIEFRSNQS